jgi:hypothetical protein
MDTVLTEECGQVDFSESEWHPVAPLVLSTAAK